MHLIQVGIFYSCLHQVLSHSPVFACQTVKDIVFFRHGLTVPSLICVYKQISHCFIPPSFLCFYFNCHFFLHYVLLYLQRFTGVDEYESKLSCKKNDILTEASFWKGKLVLYVIEAVWLSVRLCLII